MSLVSEFKDNQKVGEYPDHDEVADMIGAKMVHYEILDTTRWGHIVQYVYNRGLEYASVMYEEASGDGETEYRPDWAAVRQTTKTVTYYELLSEK